MSLCVFRNHNAKIIHEVGAMSVFVRSCPLMSLNVLIKVKMTDIYLFE